MREMNPEERLSTALRELAASSKRGASPELGLTLKDAFRHHHARRRRIVRIRLTLLGVFVSLLAGSLLLKRPLANDPPDSALLVHTIPPQQVEFAADKSTSRVNPPATTRKAPVARSDSTPANAFLALPAFDMIPAGDDLRVVRLELPGEDLRLVGVPVMEKLNGRRVTADFVVGHDGTPYAVRLVQSRY